MSVTITALEAENVKRIRAVALTPAPTGLTLVGGNNNQGKTSVLDALAWALGGERFRPDAAQRDGAVAPAHLRVTLSNGVVVERKGKNASLTVTDPTGKRSGQQLLNAFVEPLALDLPRFMEASDKEKADILLRIIGIGSELHVRDIEIKALYDKRTFTGQLAAQKKHFAEELISYPDAPDQLLSASDLIRQQQDILARNGENQRKREQLASLEARSRSLADRRTHPDKKVMDERSILMSKYPVTTGIQNAPVKVVLYGPEGIGKSTFASHFPSPVFIDTEGGTKRLDVARLPQPTSWAMLLDEVQAVRRGEVPCGTLVIDTADWAERLCIRAVCARGKVSGIEDFGYGKGYTYVKEEFAKLLDALEEVLDTGHNVVVLAHAAITKFEQPDAAGSYDRWSMKTTKQTEPLLREWCDMLLFANYRTIVEKSGNGANAKNKATGGRRVLYTTHHACWDAKNRFGLPDELPLEYNSIAPCIPGSSAPEPPVQSEQSAKQPEEVPAPKAEADILPAPAPQPEPPASAVPEALLTPDLIALGVPEKLAPLMSANNITPEEIQYVVGKRGYFPADMHIRDYPADFVEGCLVAAWPQVLQMVLDNRDLPF